MELEFDFSPITAPIRGFNELSNEAHESVKESKETTYNKILEAYKRRVDGMTSEECAFEAKISYESAHKRIAELISQHKLYNSGIKRMNKSGRRAEVRKIVI